MRLLRGRGDHLFVVASLYTVAAQSIVSGPLVAQLLGPGRRGQYAVSITAIQFAGSIATLGLYSALNGRASRFNAAAIWVGTAAWRRLALVLGLLLAVPAAFISGSVGVDVVAILGIGVVYALANPYMTVSLSAMNATGQYRRMFAARATGAVALMLGLIAFAVGDVHSVLAIVVLYSLSAQLPLLIPVKREKHANAEDVSAVRSFVRQDVPASATYSLLTLGNARLDQVLLPATLSNADIGLYAVASNYGSIVSPLAGSIASISMRKTARGNYRPSMRRRLIPIALATLFLAAVAEWVVPLAFGRAFHASVPATIIMCGAGFVQACAILFTGDLIALGKARSTIPGGALAFASVPLTLPLSSAFGIVGAASASVLCYSIDASWQLAMIRRHWRDAGRGAPRHRAGDARREVAPAAPALGLSARTDAEPAPGAVGADAES